MKIIKAESAGFCFGVKELLIQFTNVLKPEPMKKFITYGPIIHNEEVVKDMEKEVSVSLEVKRILLH